MTSKANKVRPSTRMRVPANILQKFCSMLGKARIRIRASMAPNPKANKPAAIDRLPYSSKCRSP